MPVSTSIIASLTVLDRPAVGAPGDREPAAVVEQESIFALIQQVSRQRSLLLQSLLRLGTTRAMLLHTTLPETLQALAQIQGLSLESVTTSHLPSLEEIRDSSADIREQNTENAAALSALALYGDVRWRTTDLSWLLGRSSGRMLLGERLSEPLRRQLRGEWDVLPQAGAWTPEERQTLVQLSRRLEALRGTTEQVHAELWRSLRDHAARLHRLQWILRTETDYTALHAVSGLRDTPSPACQIMATVRACQQIYAEATMPLQEAADLEPLPPRPAGELSVWAAAA